MFHLMSLCLFCSGAETGDKSPPKRPSQQRRSTEPAAATQIRTTRASRLRAAAASNTSPSSESALSDSKTHSSSATRLKSTPLRRVNADYPDSSSSSREVSYYLKFIVIIISDYLHIQKLRILVKEIGCVD